VHALWSREEMQAACQVGDNRRHNKQPDGCDVT
jgi:hypothetical protein